MRILGIESSCDESAVAWLEAGPRGVRKLTHLVASQEIHAKYGGVVPEVAAREHSSALPPLLAALADKVVGKPDGRLLGRKADLIAATRGPGLITSLKVGLDTGRALAAAWRKPVIGINHIEGHIYANWLPGGSFDKSYGRADGIFPALVLVVSGGHTELLLMKGHRRFELLGATRDDAAGEAFDKTAKMMGLGYPGGPALSRLAASGDPRKYDFPRPMIGEPHDEFSFAGLKTAVRYFLRDRQESLADQAFLADTAASIEQAIVDVLVAKTVRAAKKGRRVRTVLLAGGVAANRKLRGALAARLAVEAPDVRFVEPPLEYCTDNAAMIAAAGYFNAKQARPGEWVGMDADPHWELGRGRP